jgi:hypothetical protein
MRRAFTLVLLAACGARTEIAGEPSGADASLVDVGIGVDAALDDAPIDLGDAVAVDGAVCGQPQAMVFFNGDKTACKVQVTITCGETTYSLGGECDLPDAADWPDADLGGQGGCRVDGTTGPLFAYFART